MDKIWLDSYSKNASFEINPDSYNSIVEVIDETCSKYQDRSAFINMDVEMTYGEVAQKSDAFANYLIEELKLKKGDVIMIQMPNLLQYPVALYGAFKAGLIVVNTNPLYTEREVKKVLKDSGAKAIVICSNFVSKLEAAMADSKIEHVITTDIGDFFPFLKRNLVNFTIKYIKKMVPSYKGTYTSLNTAIDRGSKLKASYPKLLNTDIALLQYTGGTTGKTKAAVLTHRNIIANMLQMAVWIKSGLGEGEYKVLAPLPIYHVFTFSVNILGFFYMGTTNLLITNPRDLDSVVKDIKNHRPEVATIVNTLLQALLNHQEFQKLDLSYMKLSVAGGMALKVAVKKKWEEITKSSVVEGYGLTEASPVVTCNPVDGRDIAGSIGIPLPSTDIKIVDEQENELGLNEEGELCVKGPQVMQGYWKQEEETAKTFTKDGWLKTGDFACIDEKGFVKILDRKKDMIVVSGFNVYPNEVEEVLLELDGVQDVAAIGVDNEKSGEVVKVFIVKNKEITKDDIKNFSKKNLAGYKVPKEIEFRDELPKNNVGKVLRRELR
ncbi:long-chain-fatty-acid--CoA ligase [Halobacteriovorax vibrionivorans]|uniref:Long-chain-fatty-acid--CoA ligase n=1 Tax=Halobacteriovorax vibrionivorans TaxID=2152716 RepID=A0ABY0II83_9BACT|nr:MULTISPECIES: AMP-binding protein [Halobacteriovorax]RZF21586.1 long-chain-fatty-acid--CoA ligase [Halobacteriovorax vibrionivorans]TGD49121.1 long-chain-fatty-acid--CoA ligase [Halobacteriovorax sp. Y22]